MKIAHTQENLDDLAATAVRLGREVFEATRALHLGGTAKQTAFVSRCLAHLGERQPFDISDEGGLDAVQKILDEDIAAEVIGTVERFVETYFDEIGQHGEVREVQIHSDRGLALIKLQCLFQDFLTYRRSVLDHLSAHSALLKIMTA